MAQDPKAALTALLGDEAKLTEIAQGIMKELDTDKSGSLEFNEVKNLITGFCKEANVPAEKMPSEADMRKAFDALDTDKSGAVETGELVPLVKGIIQDMVN